MHIYLKGKKVSKRKAVATSDEKPKKQKKKSNEEWDDDCSKDNNHRPLVLLRNFNKPTKRSKQSNAGVKGDQSCDDKEYENQEKSSIVEGHNESSVEEDSLTVSNNIFP